MIDGNFSSAATDKITIKLLERREGKRWINEDKYEGVFRYIYAPIDTVFTSIHKSAEESFVIMLTPSAHFTDILYSHFIYVCIWFDFVIYINMYILVSSLGQI